MKYLFCGFLLTIGVNSYCQKCTISIVKPNKLLAEFSLVWNDRTFLSKVGKVEIDSTTRAKIGNDYLSIVFRNGMDKKLYVLPEILSSPFNLTDPVCGRHVMLRRQIR